MRSSPFLFLVLSLVLLACSWTAWAVPLKDLSVTSVTLGEAPLGKGTDEHLYVTVSRVDDLVDDDGSIVAERIMAVRVTFDVVEKQLRCNGVPIDIGVSNIEVEAQIATNLDKLAISSMEDAMILEDQFDVGLATVEVTAFVLGSFKTEDGIEFRRIGVYEVITEVNHDKVVQTEASQQILDVYDNGSLVKWLVDPISGAPLSGAASLYDLGMVGNDRHGAMGGMMDTAIHWWNRQSNMAQSILFVVFCAVVFGIIFAAFSYTSGSVRQGSYELIQPPKFSEEAIYCETTLSHVSEKQPLTQ